jgi:hypothetical protein
MCEVTKAFAIFGKFLINFCSASYKSLELFQIEIIQGIDFHFLRLQEIEWNDLKRPDTALQIDHSHYRRPHR